MTDRPLTDDMKIAIVAVGAAGFLSAGINSSYYERKSAYPVCKTSTVRALIQRGVLQQVHGTNNVIFTEQGRILYDALCAELKT